MYSLEKRAFTWQETKFERDEKRRIYADYLKFTQQRIPKSKIFTMLCEHYERGEFSIKKVIKEFTPP